MRTQPRKGATSEPTEATTATAEPTTAEPTSEPTTEATTATAEPTTAEPTTAEPTTAEPTSEPTSEPTEATTATAEPATLSADFARSLLIATLDAVLTDHTDPTTGTVDAMGTDALRGVIGKVRGKSYNSNAIESDVKGWALDKLDTDPDAMVAANAVRKAVVPMLAETARPSTSVDPVQAMADRIRVGRAALDKVRRDFEAEHGRDAYDKAVAAADADVTVPAALVDRVGKVAKAISTGTRTSTGPKQEGTDTWPLIVELVNAAADPVSVGVIQKEHTKRTGAAKGGAVDARWTRYTNAISKGAELAGANKALADAGVVPVRRADGTKAFARKASA